MKRFFPVSLLAVLAVAAITLVSCGGPKQAIKMTVWMNGADSFIGPNEQQKPQDQWYISQAFRRFEKANPGVTLELVVQADQNAAHTNFKTAGLAGNAPDVANLWTGQPIFALKDVILPLDKLVPADDLKKIVGWESVRDGFKPDGTILGYPAGQNQICFMMYNKAIVKKAGMDWEANPPQTIEEFDAALAKIKAIGVTPILVDEAAQSVCWWLAWVADYWWAQLTGNEQILQETYGEKKFSDDKGFLKVLDVGYRAFYKKGYFRKDMATSNDSFTQFLNGKGAIWPSVTAQLADAEKALGPDLGVLLPCSIDPGVKLQNSTIGGPGQSLVVAKNTKYPEMAVKLISFLNSKAEVLAAEKINRYPVVRTDITPQEMGWAADSNIAKIQKYSTTYNYWVDNLLTSDVANVFYLQAVLVATGKMTAQQFVTEMDKKSGR
jgi:raffinose/stachyose/melibiose transport system substrate-binding protein